MRPTRTFPGGTATIYPPALPPRRLFQIPDKDLGNASELGDPFSTGYAYTQSGVLSNPNYDLTNTTTPIPSGSKEHPYYRSEWYQKVLNLSTVRTHQYAVWITVGFFEVTSQGESQPSHIRHHRDGGRTAQWHECTVPGLLPGGPAPAHGLRPAIPR